MRQSSINLLAACCINAKLDNDWNMAIKCHIKKLLNFLPVTNFLFSVARSLRSLSISRSPENYVQSSLGTRPFTYHASKLFGQDGSSLERHAFQFAINCHLGCRTGLQMSGRPHLITNSIDRWSQVIVMCLAPLTS